MTIETTEDGSVVLLTLIKGQGADEKADRVIVAVREFKGHKYVDFRTHTWLPHVGKFVPTKKGVTVALRDLQDLANALDGYLRSLEKME